MELPTFLGMNTSVAVVLVQRPRGDADFSERIAYVGSLTGAEGQILKDSMLNACCRFSKVVFETMIARLLTSQPKDDADALALG